MDVRICHDKKEWNAHLLAHTEAEFLQSWEWGEFQESVGNKTVRLFWDGGLAQGFVHELGLGMRYLYIPRFQISDFRFQNVIDYLRGYEFIFLRLEPIEYQSAICNLQSAIVANRQPRHTLILDINKSEDELLAQMHPKTRYNIGLAEKKGVEVREEKNIDVFWKLNQETIKRGKFKSHEKSYYEKMLEMDICRQLTAYHNDKPLVSNLLIIFNNTCTYLHGASSFSDKNLMAPYLLQWEGIKLAKKSGCKNYDFWGVAPPASDADKMCFHNLYWDKSHPWSGVTRFKAGFGGRIKEYPQAVDVILKPWQYRTYKLIHKILLKY